MEAYFGNFQIGRLLIWRALAGIYLIAFISALNQFPVLLGAKGFLPVTDFLRQVSWKQTPSIFHLYYSDFFFMVIGWLGVLFSLLALLGVTEKCPWWMATTSWLVLWFLYLSIVNVGQTFYSFGWESMLVEAGFFAAFLGSSKLAPALIPVLALRWMLFRTELGAGLIKLRSDECWRNLTCLYYHYETQPMPNPLSWYFNQLPQWFQRFSVFFSHVVQVVLPFGLFAPQRVAAVSGAFIVFHQLLLVISGNYSWLNWLTIILGLTAFSDSIFSLFSIKAVAATARSLAFDWTLYALAALTLILSIPPTLNFFSRNQLMNYNYNPFHLVGSYGAFGSVTKQRYEIVLEGTNDPLPTSQAQWKEYGFKAKPGDIMRRPPQFAPYHLRLDWLMWFLPFSVNVTDSGIFNPGYQLWFLRFVHKLLEADAKTLSLMGKDPFAGKPPRFVRARFYLYRFTSKAERTETGAWWHRTLVGEYLPPVDLSLVQNI